MAAIYDALEDSKLMKRLWSYRWTGRWGYSPRSLWRAVIAGYFLNISTAIGLVRRLQEDQELLNLCGFSRAPSRITVGRFLRRLAENMEQDAAVCEEGSMNAPSHKCQNCEIEPLDKKRLWAIIELVYPLAFVSTTVGAHARAVSRENGTSGPEDYVSGPFFF
ncbi:MAG: transposase [Dehalococcoidia bacterium]